MKKFILYLILCLISAAPVLAAPITTMEAQYYTVNSSTVSDVGTTSAAIAFSRAATKTTSGATGEGAAAINTQGLVAETHYNNGLGMNYENSISPEAGSNLKTPVSEAISFVSTATWEETFVADVTGDYAWHTVVPYAEIHIYYDTFNRYLESSMNLTAGFEGIVSANGEEVFRFGAKSHFNEGGGYSSTHRGIGGSPLTNSHAGDPTFLDVTGWWKPGPYSFETDLGTFDTNDLINIELSISTYINGTGSQNGADVFLGASGGVEGTGGVYGFLTPENHSYTPPVNDQTPVPEPATFLLLGSGLAGLTFYRRKRK